MRLCALLLALSTLAICFAPTQAALVERDFLVPGDGLLIYDTVNRREWLDLAVTEGLDSIGLATAMANRNPLESFSLATHENLQDLANSLNVKGIYGRWPRDAESYDGAARLFSLQENYDEDILQWIREHIAELSRSTDNRIRVSDLIGGITPQGDVASPSFHGMQKFRGRGLLGAISEEIGQRYALGYVYSKWGTSLHVDYDLESNSVFFTETLGHLLDGTYFTIVPPWNENGSAFFATILSSFLGPDGINGTGGFERSGSDFIADVTGPYWLTRVAVPEPSTLALLLSASLILPCRRLR